MAKRSQQGSGEERVTAKSGPMMNLIVRTPSHVSSSTSVSPGKRSYEWNHHLCLLNISHFSSINSLEAMSKKTQEDVGEERVTAKSKPMMNLVSRCSERNPSALSSTASESLGKTRHESQSPLSSQAEMYDRTGKPVVCRDTSHEHHRLVEKAHSSGHSEWNIDRNWSSQEWKSDELMDDRTRRPVVCPQRGAPQHFVTEDDEAESDLSLGSRSFLHRVNDRVRKMLDQSSKDATQDSNKHSVIWGMFMSSTLQASVFMGKNYSDKWHSITNTEDLNLRNWYPNNQMRSME